MKRVLWLTEWYPTILQPYGGDGIERRAKAASMDTQIHVVYVKKKPGLKWLSTEVEEREYNSNLSARIYFYPSYDGLGRWIDALISNLYFFFLNLRAYAWYEQKWGKPDGIQVNVTMKDGFMAWFFKKFKGINYIVVEGWGLFLPECSPTFREKNFFFRYWTKKVLLKASRVIAISHHLGECMQLAAPGMAFEVIPSVVDQSVFYPADEVPERKPFRFVHISDCGHAKNVDQMLRGFKAFMDEGYDAVLTIHTPHPPKLMAQVETLGLEKAVTVLGQGPQEYLAESIRASHALILFSTYETFGNVIIEAQACGLPVVTSNYPTFKEIIVEGRNGVMAEGMDAEALRRALNKCIESWHGFDKGWISEYCVKQYGFEQISKSLGIVYRLFF